jgi:hypothetical protein
MDFGITVVMIEWTQKVAIMLAGSECHEGYCGRQMVRDTLDKM